MIAPAPEDASVEGDPLDDGLYGVDAGKTGLGGGVVKEMDGVREDIVWGEADCVHPVA